MKTMQHNNADDKNFSLTICPVPLRQQPVFQYRELRERSFFRWAILNTPMYSTKLSVVWATGFMLTLYAVTIQSKQYRISLSNIMWGAIVGEFAVFGCLLKLYAAWNYVHSRLIDQKIAYEVPRENKVAIWQKSQLMIVRDYLIARFQVRHLLERIKHTISLILFLFGIKLSILFLIANPQFMYR